MSASCIVVAFVCVGEVAYVAYSRCHPGVGPPHSASTGGTNAMQPIEVEYFGQTYAPFTLMCKWLNLHTGRTQALLHGLLFILGSRSIIHHTHADNGREGTNALDAAFLAYSNISVLRQQMKPDHRVHGIIEGKEWASNGMFLLKQPFTCHNHIGPSHPGLCEDAIYCASGCQW